MPSWSLGWGAQWTNNLGPLATGGWSDALPSASRVSKTYTVPSQQFPPRTVPPFAAQPSATPFDANGTQHNLYMSHVFNNYPTTYNGNNYPVNYACQQSGYTSGNHDNGGDPIVLSNLFGATSGQNYLGPSDGSLAVADPDGTVYSFAGFSYPTPQGSSYPALLVALKTGTETPWASLTLLSRIQLRWGVHESRHASLVRSFPNKFRPGHQYHNR